MIGVVPQKFCAFQGCNALVAGGCCDEHGGEKAWSIHGVERGSAAARGYDANWLRIRLYVLRRQPICATVGCNRPASECDHIKPKRSGGTNAISNLQGLCRQCHSRKTATEDGGFGNKRKE